MDLSISLSFLDGAGLEARLMSSLRTALPGRGGYGLSSTRPEFGTLGELQLHMLTELWRVRRTRRASLCNTCARHRTGCQAHGALSWPWSQAANTQVRKSARRHSETAGRKVCFTRTLLRSQRNSVCHDASSKSRPARRSARLLPRMLKRRKEEENTRSARSRGSQPATTAEPSPPFGQTRFSSQHRHKGPPQASSSKKTSLAIF